MINNKAIHNAKWIIICRIMRAVVQLVISMLSARYLGPSNYGLINYAASIVAFFVPVMQLGMQFTLVHEYIDEPAQEGKVLGTSLVLNMLSALACIFGVVSFAFIANRNEPVTITVCALYSLSLLFQSLDMQHSWFHARLISKYASMASLAAFVLVGAYKIYLLAQRMDVHWFALSYSIEYAVSGVLLLLVFRKKSDHKIAFSMETARRLLAKSKHYILPALMIAVYNSIGSILLKLLVGETANGYYAVAVSCAGVTGFVFDAIIDSARPVILESRQHSHAEFEKNISRLYGVTTYLSLTQSLVFTCFADFAIRILYGEEFAPAALVLRILIWGNAFSYMGYSRNIWILGEEMHEALLPINLCGMTFSVISNLCFIPLLGECGAAIASVATQIFTNFIMGFVLKRIRSNNRLMLRGLNPRLLIEMIDMFRREINATRD